MPSIRQNKTAVDWLKYAVVTAGSLTLLLGSVVLAGWHTHTVALVQVLPTLVPMQYNTALGFVLCGIGLLSVTYGRRSLVMVYGVITVGIGLLTLIEYLFELDLGIDQLLFTHDITIKTSHPGRMAPSTALAFVLCGVSLLLMSRPRWMKYSGLILGVFAPVITAMGTGISLGYLAGLDTPFGWSHFTYMAVHTAIGFIILGTGLFLLAIRTSLVKRHMLNWVSVAIGISVATVGVTLWQAMLAQERIQSTRIISEQVTNLKSTFENEVKHEILALERMARRWEQQGKTPKKLWVSDATLYIQHHPVYQAISWVDPTLHVRWIEPLQGNEEAKDLYLGFETRRKKALESARDRHVTTVTRPIDLVQGGKGFIVYVPIYVVNRFDGFMGGVFRIKPLVNATVNETVSEGYAIELFDDNKLIYSRKNAGNTYLPDYAREQAIEFYDINWRIRLIPSQALMDNLRSSLPEITLAGTMVLALLTTLTVWFYQGTRRRAAEFEELNRELTQQIAERERVEKALEESEVWMRGIFNSLAEGVFVATPDRKLVNLNPAGQVILGYQQEEIFDQSTEMLHVDHEHYVEFGRMIKAAFDKDEIAHFEFELKRKNGQVFPSEHWVSLVKNDQGETVGIVSSVLDIIERKRIEKALEESELWMRGIFNALEEGVVVITPDRQVVNLNPAGQTMAGYSLQEIINQSTEILHVDHDHYVEFGNRSKAAFDKGEAACFEFEAKRKNGEIFPTEHTVSLIKDDEGSAIGIVNVTRDITARKQTEEELRRHREHLEEIVAARTHELQEINKQLQHLTGYLLTVREEERVRIARDVHDELGQVLTALNMDTYWMTRHIPKDQAGLLHKLKSMCSSITLAIESVQRITSELRPAILDELGLEPAVQWYIEQFQENTDIDCNVSIEFDEITLDAERSIAVFRILQEALTNVARHSGATEVDVEIRIEGKHLVLSLHDNGKGITPDNINAIDAHGLTGMKERALAFGGGVDIEGHAGEGTTITLYLPLNNTSESSVVT